MTQICILLAWADSPPWCEVDPKVCAEYVLALRIRFHEQFLGSDWSATVLHDAPTIRDVLARGGKVGIATNVAELEAEYAHAGAVVAPALSPYYLSQVAVAAAHRLGDDFSWRSIQRFEETDTAAGGGEAP